MQDHCWTHFKHHKFQHGKKSYICGSVLGMPPDAEFLHQVGLLGPWTHGWGSGAQLSKMPSNNESKPHHATLDLNLSMWIQRAWFTCCWKLTMWFVRMPQICLAYSMTANCMPGQIPRYGVLFSRAHFAAWIILSVTRMPKPPSVRVPSVVKTSCHAL